MGKAKLVFPIDAKVEGQSNIFDVSIVQYSSGYEVQLTDAITRNGKHYYPIRTKEKPLNIRIQCFSNVQYHNLIKTIANTQLLAVHVLYDSFIRFSYPEFNLNYLGYIDSVPELTVRFVEAPILNIVFTPYLDTINTLAQTYSNANGTWKDIFGDDVVDLNRGQDAGFPDDGLGPLAPSSGNNDSGQTPPATPNGGNSDPNNPTSRGSTDGGSGRF